jgi:hypothetical protein
VTRLPQPVRDSPSDLVTAAEDGVEVLAGVEQDVGGVAPPCLAPRQTVDLILDYVTRHHGTRLGILTNRRQAVVFLAHGQGYGLTQHDLVEEFLLLYYSILLHMHTRGTWSAYECVDPDRGEHLPYCAPAQLVAPLLTRWMLVFEQPEDGALWLAKATPRRWLASGRRIAVRGAATRWGAIGYEITSRLEARAVQVRLMLPPGPVPQVNLRLRVPRPHRMLAVRVDGAPWEGFDPPGETVTLPPGRSGDVHLDVQYS